MRSQCHDLLAGHTLEALFIALTKHAFFGPQFFINFSSVSLLSSFSSSLRLHLEAFFSAFFFCFAVEGGSGPLKKKKSRPSPPLRTSKMCVLRNEKHHFYISVKVVVDIAFGPQKPPKIGPLKLFQVYTFGF